MDVVTGRIFLGIGYGNLSSSMQAIAIKVSPTNKYGIANINLLYWFRYRYRFGPSLLGLFTGFISYTEVYIIMAIVAKTLYRSLLYCSWTKKLKHN